MGKGYAMSPFLNFAFVITFLLSVHKVLGESLQSFSLLMPNVSPSVPDSYICTSVRIDPSTDYYITGFEPNTTMKRAHHMLLFGCTEPGTTEETWNCGEMSTKQPGYASAPSCRKGSRILYAWAKDAPKLTLPEGVAFKIGGRTDMQFLVLQIHYASPDIFKDGSTDNSGVILQYTETPQLKTAGVLMLGTGGQIRPQSVEYMESACMIRQDTVIHPFAFRTHTHGLGIVVSGYKIEIDDMGETWTLIGKKNPQLPQMFYPVENDITIQKGDFVAARCTMASDKDFVTRVGPTRKDEMCNFYIMYWTYKREPLEQKYCFTPGPPNYYWIMEFASVPSDASLLD